MPTFDPRSFIVISTCLAALCGFVCFVLRRSIPKNIQGLNCWGSACTVMVFASVLFALRGSLDILYSSYVANIAVVTGVALMYSSIGQFLEVKSRRRLYVAVPVVLAALLIWPTFVVDSYRVRIVVVSTVNAWLFMASAYLIWSSRRKSFAEYFTMTVFGATGLVSALRCVAAILSASTSQPLTDASSVQYIYLATFAFSLVALSLGFILMVSKRLQIQLENAALHDGLTGIATRSAFQDLASLELTRSQRKGCVSSLLMIDLDNFKTINDHHGHRGGDRVLKEFVSRASTVLRSHDLFGRYGGEEFVVLLPDTDQVMARQIAARICHAVQLVGEDNIPAFTASIGVATGMPKGEDINEFLDQADKALYRAKAAGKNRVESYCDIAA